VARALGKILRREKLKEKLEEMKKEKISLATLHRHLNHLVIEDEVIKIDYNNFLKFGIPSEDKREVYYALKIYEQIPRYYELVFSSLKSKDPIKKKNALIEIESMGNIRLLPSQLTELSSLLLKEKYSLTRPIMRIIYNNFVELSFPSNLKIFQDNLIGYCSKVNKELSKNITSMNDTQLNRNSKSNIIFILGILDNPIIIELLKEDLSHNKEFNELEQEGYTQWTIAPIIEKHRADLLDFQNKLTLESTMDTLRKIRKKANQWINEKDTFRTKESKYDIKYREYKGGLESSIGTITETYSVYSENQK